MPRPLLEHAFSHHRWATQRLLDACAALTPEQLETTVPGTYGSIIDTLRHLVGADCGYLARISAQPALRIEEELLDIAQLRDAIERNAVEWPRVLGAPLDPDADIVGVTDDGSKYHAPLGIRLAQVLHHGTDHRSQACTALTTLGIEPPEIDVWAYAEAAGLSTVTG